MASDKAKFGQPEIKVGVFPPIAAVTFPRFMGTKSAMELLLTGEKIDAYKAKEIGLVNQVFDADKFEEEADNFIKKLTGSSAVVLQLTKQAINDAFGQDYHIGVAKIENIYMNMLMKTHDANEGLKAFMEKREPKWKNE